MYIPLLFNAGHMQSWGYSSYKRDRDTKQFPTQSAVTGMIARASGNYTSKIGKERFEDFLLNLLDGKFFSMLFRKNSIIEDFQTIGINYAKEEQIPRATGDQKPTSVIVKKQYLENAVTGCIIEHDENTINMIFNSLKCPESFIGIGRACCIPIQPITSIVTNNYKDAFLNLVERSGIYGSDIIKVVSPNNQGYSITDVMVGHQKFLSRLIVEEDRSLDEWKMII